MRDSTTIQSSNDQFKNGKAKLWNTIFFCQLKYD